MADTGTPALKKYQRTPGAKGGPRPGAGRKKDVPNKVSQTLKELAREYTAEALEGLVQALRTETGSARVQAANAILDRGYGKPSTVLAGDEDGNPVKMVHEILLRGVRPG
jgi:hypothetical protein